MMHPRAGWLACFVLSLPTSVVPQQHVEKNVVYGMLSGLALTMDIYSPDSLNGLGVILIPGSAWDGRSTDYTNWEVKAGYPYINRLRDALVSEGFVVFVPNHRMSPVHRYPSAVEDARQAVRFIRNRAAELGVDPRRVGAVGHSSGGYLCSLLGVLDDERPSEGEDPIPFREYSARVQAVVSITTPYDLANVSESAMPFVVAYMGERPPMDAQWQGYLLQGRYADASPIAHVSADDAAFMIVYASGDPMVRPRQAESMKSALEKAGVPVDVLPLSDESHTPELDVNRLIEWLKSHL